jgi:hypothetical protein
LVETQVVGQVEDEEERELGEGGLQPERKAGCDMGDAVRLLEFMKRRGWGDVQI